MKTLLALIVGWFLGVVSVGIMAANVIGDLVSGDTIVIPA